MHWVAHSPPTHCTASNTRYITAAIHCNTLHCNAPALFFLVLQLQCILLPWTTRLRKSSLKAKDGQVPLKYMVVLASHAYTNRRHILFDSSTLKILRAMQYDVGIAYHVFTRPLLRKRFARGRSENGIIFSHGRHVKNMRAKIKFFGQNSY